MLAAAAEHIAVTMVQAAFAHLPAERSAGALAMARTEPMARMLQAITVEAYSEGRTAGVRSGRLELEREMENDWSPMAERVRASAGSPSFEELERLRSGQGGNYPGGPVAQW